MRVGVNTFGKPPKILVIAPTLVTDNIHKFSDRYNTATQKSLQIPGLLKDIATKHGVHFLDASKVTKPSDKDGMHLDELGHKRIAKAVAKILRMGTTN